MSVAAWVLVLIVSTNYRGATIDHVPVASREACQMAVAKLNARDSILSYSFCLNTQTGEMFSVRAP